MPDKSNHLKQGRPKSGMVAFNLSVPADILAKVKQMAAAERRLYSQMGRVLLTEAIERREMAAKGER